jgi:Uma2 family endonuclease
MAEPALPDPVAPERWTAEQYLRLVDDGVLGPDDDVELLEGVIVSMSPSNVAHEAGIRLVIDALYRVAAGRAAIGIQLPLNVGHHSVPEPDAAIVPGTARDYTRARPTTAWLVVEVADSSLRQDRITKSAMYAAAGIPEYWIVNLVDECVEVRRDPEPAARRYRSVTIMRRGDAIELVALPGARLDAGDLLP